MKQKRISEMTVYIITFQNVTDRIPRNSLPSLNWVGIKRLLQHIGDGIENNISTKIIIFYDNYFDKHN